MTAERAATKCRSRRRLAATFALRLAACAFVLFLPGWAHADAPDSPEGTQPEGMLSLIELSPELYFVAKRYARFFGDANTVDGNLLERSFLLGDPGGVRRSLVDRGIYLDAGVTQFIQGNISNGDDTSSSPRYNGSADIWLWFDTGKAGLWPGGALYVHAESRWYQRINSEVGSLLPSNFDAVMPSSADSNWALSEWYLLQGLPGNLLAIAGKVDMAAWADTNMFANHERSQFNYTGFINNPIAGVFFPYTTQGAWLTWAPTKAHALTVVYAASDDRATISGFDKIADGNNSYALQYIFATEIAGRPGRYVLDGAYSTKKVVGFAADRRYSSFSSDPQRDFIIGVPVLEDESENYGAVANFSQYLWVKGGSAEAYNRRLKEAPYGGFAHHNAPPIGFGLFGRAGWAPKDRNVIDQFYSFGIGGYGMLIPGRDGDQWGIGWAGTHISSDLRDLPTHLRAWEHAFEVFYNLWLTPAVHVSLNTQVVRSAIKANDTAVTLGTRLQLDF